MLTQPSTTKSQTQHPFPAQTQAHFIQNGSRLAESWQYSCFLHDANMLDQQGMGYDPRTPTLRQVREVCVHRENRLNEWSLSLLLREKRERERRDPSPPSSPCVGSKRAHVPAPTPHITTQHSTPKHKQHIPHTHSQHKAHTPHCTHTLHTRHTRMLGHVHGGQPTVILHSVKIGNICNVCNLYADLLFWN